jgi:hypothetical protein
MNFTEKQLLYVFSELYILDNRITEWSLEKFKDNPPRFFRLQMINSLMNALNLNCSYNEFKNGKFISDKHLDKWPLFRNEIINKFQLKSQKSQNRVVKCHHIETIFYCFINYRLHAEKLLTSNDAIYAASHEFLLFSKLMTNSNLLLKKELKKVDKILFFLINPEGISYSKEQLIEQFNYPNLDLNEIDLDWI